MDFNYGNKTITSSGGFKPSTKNTPLDVRTRVKTFAEIQTIPNPYIGMIITVEADETNSGKMTDYKVKSLKADSFGVADSVVDEVVKYVDYLGITTGGAGNGSTADLTDYQKKTDNTLTTTNKTVVGAINEVKNELDNKVDKIDGKGLSTEDFTTQEKADLANLKTTVGDNSSGLVKEVADIKDTELQNLNTAIQTLETLVGVDEALGDKSGLPAGDENVIASINRIDGKTVGGGTGLTTEQANQLTTAYEHSQSTHVQSSDIPTKTSQLTNDSKFVTTSEMNNAISNIGSSGSSFNIQDFYNSSKNGKKIVMLGDSTVISGAGGGAVSARFAKYQESGNCLEGCTVENQGAIGKTLNKWVNNEMSNVVSNSSDVDLYIFCLGINDLMNDGKTEEEVASDFKLAMDGLLNNTNAYILLRLPCISKDKYEWGQILRRIYMSYKGYNSRIDVIDIPLLTAYETNTNIFLADNVHPTDNGYYMVVDEMVARICSLNTKLLDSEKTVLFKGYITKINSNILTVISSNDFNNISQIGTLYINDVPYQHTSFVKVSQNTYQITLSNEYTKGVGIVRILGNAIDNTSNASNINPNDWYSLGDSNRLWFAIKIPSEAIRSDKITLSVNCSGYYLGGGSLRMTPIRRQAPNDTTGQSFGTAATSVASSDNNVRINNFYFNSSVGDDGTSEYVICSLDVLNVSDTSNTRIGNFKIKVNDINITLDSFEFVNCGTPKKATTPILMTHDRLIQLLTQLGVVTSNSYKMLPNTIIRETTSDVYGNIILNTNTMTIVEGGQGTFTIKLDKQPTNNQIVSLAKNNDDITLSADTLTFTTSNWNTEQTVTITVAEDDADYSDESCIITCVSNNVSAQTVTVTITDNDTPSEGNVSVTSISLDKTSYSLKPNETVQLTATVSPDNATNKNVVWSSNNSNCTVSNGLVTGITEGSSIITATTEDGNHTATCNITVVANSSSTDGYVTNGLMLNLDARDLSESSTTWTDTSGNSNDVTLNNITFGTNASLTGTTFKINKTTPAKEIINKAINIGDTSSLSGITAELNYKCDTARTTSAMKTVIAQLPCNLRLTEKSNEVGTIYFENYSNMKLGNITTNDSTGGNRNIVVTFNKDTGNHVVYLDGVQVLADTGNVNSSNFANTSLIIKNAIGFDFEIGSIRFYNRILTADEISQNNSYEKSLNR